MEKKLKVFLDSNVLFSIAYSGKGKSRSYLLFELQKLGFIDIYISKLVKKETIFNLNRKKPKNISFFKKLIPKINLLADVFIKFKTGLLEMLPENDRVILTTALYYEMDFFLTGNTRNFKDLYNRKIGKTLILKPADFLHRVF